jgi:uncharacterized protein DUF87
MKHPIPDAALDDRLGFIGRTGSGKTFGAGVCVERILAKKGRVIIPDPLGVWFGLRLEADGKTPSPYDVVVFGGKRGDLPLTPLAGALIGETVAGMRESAIIDLSQFDTAAQERRFMLAFLDAIYRKTRGEPVHIVFDEADLFAPERIMDKEGEATKLHGMMQTVVRRGRIKGLTSWLITQRPAVLSKSVLSQMDGLVAFQLTSPTDRKALGAWIEGQADRDQGKEILARLPEKKQGEAVVWLPARGILDDVTFPLKETYDSSRAPKRGEKQRAVELKPLDLAALKDRLSTVEAEVKANDPKALRAELAQARQKITALERRAQAAEIDAAIDPEAAARAEHKGYSRGKVEGYGEALASVSDMYANLVSAIGTVQDELVNVLKQAKNIKAWAEAEAKKGPKRDTQRSGLVRPARPPAPFRDGTTVGVQPAAPTPQRTNRYIKVPSTDGQDRPLGAERKPLAALAAVHPSGMTESQWAVAAGLKRRGGTWTAYKSRLISAGRVARQGNVFFATQVGLADLGEEVSPLPPPGAELVEFWARKISGIGPMLRHLARVYPDWLTREQLAEDIDLTHSGGTFTAYLSRLRSPGLIEEDDDKRVRAATELMEGA